MHGYATIGLALQNEAANRFYAPSLARKELTVRRKRWIRASLLTMIAAAPVVGTLAASETAVAAQDPGTTAQLADVVNGDIPSRRQDAADQLVTRADAVPVVKQILRNPDNQPGQIAVARSLAKSINPNPAYIPELQKLLGSNPDMTEAAAEALAAMSFDDHPDAFTSLKNFINNSANPENIRVTVIDSLGQIVQKAVADYLVQLTAVPNQSPALSDAATGALTELTGIGIYVNNPRQWQQWWAGLANPSPAEFRSRVLLSRDAQFKLYKQHSAQLLKDAGEYLEQNYADLLKYDKPTAQQTLLGYLNDPMPEIRDIGVDSIHQYALTDQSVYTGDVRAKLLGMINDPDEHVRLSVVRVLLDVNDHDAVKLLIARLKVEKRLAISVEIIKSLGKLQDPQALPALLDLLHDPQPELVITAANAIAHLGPRIQNSGPDQSDKATAELRKIADPSAVPPARDDVRAACLAALAALRDKQSLNLFLRLAQPAENSQVRQAALLGLGNLGDTRANEQVMNQLDDNDKEVRAAAAVALETTATPDQAEKIFGNMKSDPYPKVSDALWIALQNLYAKESTTDLERWASELSYDPDKRLVTLLKLGDAYAAEKDANLVAENQQAIADVMMQVKPPRTLEAIRNLQAALAYWRGPGNGDADKLEGIVSSLLEDQLEANQWTDATSFAADQIKIAPVYQATVGPVIKSKADELSTRDPDAANALIDAALKMNPPLEGKYVDQLQEIRDSIKNKAPTPPG